MELRESELELNLCRWQRRLQQMEDRLLRCDQQSQPVEPARASPAVARDGGQLLRHVCACGVSASEAFVAASSEACCALSDRRGAAAASAASPIAQPVESSPVGSDRTAIALSTDVGLGRAHAAASPALQHPPPAFSAEPVGAILCPNEAPHASLRQAERPRARSSGVGDNNGSGRALSCSRSCVPEAFAFQMKLEASSDAHAGPPPQCPRRASPLPRKTRTPSGSLEGAHSLASAATTVGEERRNGHGHAVSVGCEGTAASASQMYQPTPQEPPTSDDASAAVASATSLGAAGSMLLARPIHLRRPAQRHYMCTLSLEEFREIVSSRAQLRPCEFGFPPRRPSTAALADAARPHLVLLSDDEADALRRARAGWGRILLHNSSAPATRPSYRTRSPERGLDASFGSGSVAGLRNRLHELRAGRDGV
jgi:hypothetical protein